jgi:hypothetical protein
LIPQLPRAPQLRAGGLGEARLLVMGPLDAGELREALAARADVVIWRERQVQMVAVKPVARWQIWLGKWLGIVTLNAALLALAGAGVYALLLWRATKLPANEQAILRNEILVARGSAREKDVEAEIDANTEKVFQENLQKNPSAASLPDDQKRKRAGRFANRLAGISRDAGNLSSVGHRAWARRAVADWPLAAREAQRGRQERERTFAFARG